MLADVFVVIDIQKGVLTNNGREIYKHDELLRCVNKRIDDYRTAEKPIIFIQHNDEGLSRNSDGWQLLENLDFRSTDTFVDKIHADGFYKTTLAERLSEMSAGSLEICGAETPFCVDATVKAVFDRGYRIQMQSGVTSTFDNEWMTAETCVAFYEAVWHYFAMFVN